MSNYIVQILDNNINLCYDYSTFYEDNTLDKTTPSYNLNVVVRETGIKPDTLRAWERRYGLPDPVRTEGGHRLYSDRDIEMIKWFIARQEEGMRISQAVKMWKELIENGSDPVNPQGQIGLQSLDDELAEIANLTPVRNAWIEACLAYDEYKAEQILAQTLARYPLNLVVVEVLQKGLAEIGNGWFEGTVTVQQEHFTSLLVIRRLNALISTAPAPTRKERILVGTPPGEEHIVSSLLLALFLRYQGWDVTNLGVNVPIEDLEDTINQVSPDLVIYTAALITTAASLRQVALKVALHGVSFAFGGRAFSIHPTLAERVTGYYLGPVLDGAVQVVADILEKKLKPNKESSIQDKYNNTYKAFANVLPDINARMLALFDETPEDLGVIDMANQQFGGYLLAGLSLGDLSLVEHELKWASSLIKNSKMPEHLLKKYLEHYQDTVESEMGSDGQVLVDWLDELKF